MKKNSVLLIVIFNIILFSSCKRKEYKKADFIGIYIGNEMYEIDTIEIISDSVYYHYGTFYKKQGKFSDTSNWKIDRKELVFENFCFYQDPDLPVNDTSYFKLRGVWVSEFSIKKDTIFLNISRDHPYYYKKIK